MQSEEKSGKGALQREVRSGFRFLNAVPASWTTQRGED